MNADWLWLKENYVDTNKECPQSYLHRVAHEIGQMTQPQWEALPTEAQRWYNQVVHAINLKQRIPMPTNDTITNIDHKENNT